MEGDHWWHGAVLYQIYPRSFVDSDGDGVGDLAGAISKLDYLNDGTDASLGVDGIWLSPFYPSPQVDFGYDVSDYRDVDPGYGTLADVDKLLAEAHHRGIRVLVDLVMNHTSAEHPWFLESRASRGGDRRDWYIWADPGPDGGPPNNWLSAFERCGPAWTFDPATGQYYLHSFTPEQPDLNLRNPAVRDELRDIWRFWLDRGVDGFRLDVAHRLFKDDLLRDNPPEVAHARRHLWHPEVCQYNLDRPEVHELLRTLRETLDAYGGRLALGEVPVSDECLARYLTGEGMQTAFHVTFWDQPWQAGAFRRTVDRLAGEVGPGALPTYALATHDIARTVSRYGSTERARLAAMMMLTLRGLACVYYGEEIGMTGREPPGGPLDVDGRDGQRTPMQWDAAGAGFTTGVPWLPFGRDLATVNVAHQHGDAASLLNLYRRLIWYRKRSAALREGDYRSLDSSPETYVYLRTAPGERLLVALNFAARRESVPTPPELPGSGRVEVSTRTARDGMPVALSPLVLEPQEGVVVRLD